MSSERTTVMPVKRGRPSMYLLSGIATCGVSGSTTRVGRQNASPAKLSYGKQEQPSFYRVYECAGTSGSTGFHVSMRQDHLDQIVTDAVMARISQPDFRTPRAEPNTDADGGERKALRLEIEHHQLWLTNVGKEAKRREMLYMVAKEERIVLPQIEAARARIEKLEQLDPVVVEITESLAARITWDALPLVQRRSIIGSLMAPRINPVTAAERGQREINPHRVDLQWRS